MNLAVGDREKRRFFDFVYVYLIIVMSVKKEAGFQHTFELRSKLKIYHNLWSSFFEVLNNIPRSIQKIKKRKENVSFFARSWEKVVWSSRCSIKEGFFKKPRLPANYSKKIIIPWLIVSFSFEKRSEKRRDYRPCREEPNI